MKPPPTPSLHRLITVFVSVSVIIALNTILTLFLSIREGKKK
jgi:hypothetical protein